MANLELIELTEKTSIIPGPVNIGLLKTDDGVYLIDSGNDKESGRKLNALLNDKGWKLLGIINTHSNADHIGGNAFLQKRTGCKIFSTGTEKAFIESPLLEGSVLWGGYQPGELRNKFFQAESSTVTDIITPGLSAIANATILSLKGHFFDMVGVLTSDGVAFLGDALFGTATLDKYPIPFMYDVCEYKKSLETIRVLDARYYVPSHGKIETDIKALVDKNLTTVDDIEGVILTILESETPFDVILQKTAATFAIELDIAQYALVGSTVRSFLTYLENEGKITRAFTDNILYWRRTGNY